MAADVLEWTDKGGGVFGATTKITTELSYTVRGPGREKTRTVHFRIDTRDATIRVDKLDYAVWTAIDDGQPFTTLADAQAYVARWVDAARAQKTLSPKISRAS